MAIKIAKLASDQIENSHGKKLYVGNLGPDADKASLEALFSVFGTVEKAYIVTDRQTGQSKGFGFVVMSSDGEVTFPPKTVPLVIRVPA